MFQTLIQLVDIYAHSALGHPIGVHGQVVLTW